jgi:hypothetical protein
MAGVPNATITIYDGSRGPFEVPVTDEYGNALEYENEDGTPSGIEVCALHTDGRVTVLRPPTNEHDVLRKGDAESGVLEQIVLGVAGTALWRFRIDGATHDFIFETRRDGVWVRRERISYL